MSRDFDVTGAMRVGGHVLEAADILLRTGEPQRFALTLADGGIVVVSVEWPPRVRE